MEVEELGTTEQYVKEVTLRDYDPGSSSYRKSTMLDDDDLSLSLGSDKTLSRLEKMYYEGSDGHIWGGGVCGVDAIKKMEQIYAKLALERIGVGVEEATKDAILASEMAKQDGCIRGYFGSPSNEFMTLPMQMAGWLEIGVPRFLTTTFHLVDNPDTDPFICWSEAQDSFIVQDHIKFSSIILPRYFRHKNFSSFIRQLNTYGFKKTGYDRWEFAHVYFRKGRKDMLKKLNARDSLWKKKKQKMLKLRGQL